MSKHTRTRAAALAAFLGCDVDDVDPAGMTGEVPEYEAEGKFWLVATEREAVREAGRRIREDLWAFRPEFLADYLPAGLRADAAEILGPLQERYERGNEAIAALVGRRLPSLIRDAIRYDGCAHFLGTYDGREHEEERGGRYWRIYRTN